MITITHQETIGRPMKGEPAAVAPCRSSAITNSCAGFLFWYLLGLVVALHRVTATR